MKFTRDFIIHDSSKKGGTQSSRNNSVAVYMVLFVTGIYFMVILCMLCPM